MVGLIKLKLNLAQRSALKLIGDRLHLVGLNWIIVTEELSCKNGLIGYKANLSPAKLKLADIRLELSLAILSHLELFQALKVYFWDGNESKTDFKAGIQRSDKLFSNKCIDYPNMLESILLL